MSQNFKKRKIQYNNYFYNSDLNLNFNLNYIELINFKLRPIFNEYVEKFGLMYIKKDYIQDCIKYCNKLDDNLKITHVKNCTKYVRVLYLFVEEINKYNKLKILFSKNNYSLNNIKNISLELKKINNKRKREKEKYILIYPIIYHFERVYEFYSILSNHNIILEKKLEDIFIDKQKDIDFDKINEYWKHLEESNDLCV